MSANAVCNDIVTCCWLALIIKRFLANALGPLIIYRRVNTNEKLAGLEKFSTRARLCKIHCITISSLDDFWTKNHSSLVLTPLYIPYLLETGAYFFLILQNAALVQERRLFGRRLFANPTKNAAIIRRWHLFE